MKAKEKVIVIAESHFTAHSTSDLSSTSPLNKGYVKQHLSDTEDGNTVKKNDKTQDQKGSQPFTTYL